jgi:carboxyl-terminal processing protease
VARYYTPSGRSIQAEGISPDVVVENLNQDIIEKALNKSQVRREKDILGHLEADIEGFVDDEQKTQKFTEKTEKGFMQLWWGGEDKKNNENNMKHKLLKDDFQVLQAYNYLRAWKVLKSFEEDKIKK